MTRRRYVVRDGELVEIALDYQPEPRADYHVMPDISPYKSMIDGREITSRSRHREHLKDHGCVEVGNDSSVTSPKPYKGQQSPPGLKEHIIRAVNDHEEKQRRR